jgi:hypothetical protein
VATPRRFSRSAQLFDRRERTEAMGNGKQRRKYFKTQRTQKRGNLIGNPLSISIAQASQIVAAIAIRFP